MEPLSVVTKQLQSNGQALGKEATHGAVWEALPAIDYLFQHFKVLSDITEAEQSLIKYPRQYRDGIGAGFKKLESYYALTDTTPIYRAALMLHPARKDEYFEEYWGQLDHRDWTDSARSVTAELFKKYEEAFELELAKSKGDKAVASSGLSNDELTHFGRITQAMKKRRGKRARVQTELERFLELGVEDGDEDMEDPLAWWRVNESRYPKLSKMAYDLLSTPAMSAECERVFSHCGNSITAEHNQLSQQTIEASMCQKNWLSRKLVPE